MEKFQNSKEDLAGFYLKIEGDGGASDLKDVISVIVDGQVIAKLPAQISTDFVDQSFYVAIPVKSAARITTKAASGRDYPVTLTGVTESYFSPLAGY